MIPKNIHYCWFGPKPQPKLVKKCITTWKKCLPDYELCLWNEQNSPMDHPFVQQAYRAKKYAFVADYVRFWVLYHYGGIYLDTDMYVIKSFDELLGYDCFFGYEDDKQNFVSCGVIGCVPQNNIINQIVEKYDNLSFNSNNLSEFIVPRLITPLVKEAAIMPYDYFYPFPFKERKSKNYMNYVTQDTYAIHLWDISWYPWYKKIVRDIVIWWKHEKKS